MNSKSKKPASKKEQISEICLFLYRFFQGVVVEKAQHRREVHDLSRSAGLLAGDLRGATVYWSGLFIHHDGVEDIEKEQHQALQPIYGEALRKPGAHRGQAIASS